MPTRVINDTIRKRIRQIRIARELTAVEVARRAGIPNSSYAHMESGSYRLHSDELFRILDAIGADINDVWPAQTVDLQRLQRFRIEEICNLSGAEGAAVFERRDGFYQPLLSYGLPGDQLKRLSIYLLGQLKVAQGFVCRFERKGIQLVLYLACKEKDPFACALAERYLKRFYVFIRSESGRRFRCSPNHDRQDSQIPKVLGAALDKGFEEQQVIA